jgi:hypothetical protein
MIVHKNYDHGKQKAHTFMQAESVNDFVHWLETNQPGSHYGRDAYRLTKEGQGKKYFTGVDSFAEAVKLSQEGWPKGLELCSELVARLEHKMTSRTQSHVPEYALSCGIPDIGVFLANDPECFLAKNPVEKEGFGKLVRLVVNLTCSCGYSPEDLMRRGIAVLALVDLLEKNGKSCEIVAITAARSGGQHWEIEVPIKTMGRVAEMDRIAFALAHPGFYRMLMFSAWECLNYPCTSFGIITESMCEKDEDTDYYFPSMSCDQCPTQEEALMEWILKMLAQQGIHIEA